MKKKCDNCEREYDPDYELSKCRRCSLNPHGNAPLMNENGEYLTFQLPIVSYWLRASLKTRWQRFFYYTIKGGWHRQWNRFLE